ncbi:MAG: thioredoxin family protein, partial [Sphingomonadaceae bacterium]|nr:thioredoxin family protein [Sphingomonadaceae bacterium]
ASDTETINGILRLGSDGMGLSFTASPGVVPPSGTPLKTAPGPAGIASLPVLLLGALVGGLLLNIMPCVFPILSLKALSLARAGQSESHARMEGMAYAAGVIAASLALGALLLLLRAGGEQVGWAFQLQEPGVIAVLLLLATAITANFIGLFEFTVPGFASDGSPQGAFVTGLLAAFVATPCTGPFMAAAMGAALLLPVVPALALFAVLGLGIALPFILVAFIAPLRNRLPRPGPWMTRFRRWMALPMGLTALALLWLASRVGGLNFAFAAGAIAALLVLLLGAAGIRQRGGKAALGLTATGLVALCLSAFLVLPGLVARPEASAHSDTGAIAFSEAALEKARQSGKPVFVWMTADWCITCKVNEQIAIVRPETLAAFRKAQVVVLRGDWTRRDPAITRYLTAQGAAGVPHYVWYPSGAGAPRQLPQILSQAMLIELARE